MNGKTDWKKVKKLSEKKVLAAAKADPDANPLNKKQLKTFQRVHPHHQTLAG